MYVYYLYMYFFYLTDEVCVTAIWFTVIRFIEKWQFLEQSTHGESHYLASRHSTHQCMRTLWSPPPVAYRRPALRSYVLGRIYWCICRCHRDRDLETRSTSHQTPLDINTPANRNIRFIYMSRLVIIGRSCAASNVTHHKKKVLPS